MDTDKLIKRRGYEIIVFKDSYFEGKTVCNNLEEARKLITDHPENKIRVQIGDFRLLLWPDDGNGRFMEGFTDLGFAMRCFNNPKEPHSYIMGDFYYSTPYSD